MSDEIGGGAPAPAAAPDARLGLIGYRIVLVVAQAATILLTWKVWQIRDLPPLLPLAAVPEVDMGPPLLASLVVVLILPRIGLPLHTALLAWAIVADQCRLQPHVISLAWLLWGTDGRPGGLVVARGSLAATWIWAGLHKLTSPAYYGHSGPWMLGGLWPGADPALAAPLAAAVALTEIALGLGTLVPACRRVVAGAAVVFHLGVLVVLAGRLGWDRPVWPWNLALAAAGPFLVARWHGPGLGQEWPRAPRLARGLAAALLVMPAGYWLGVVDAYLAHCVYADNTPQAFICSPFTRRNIGAECRRHDVILPPAHRLYVPFFRGVGRSGEWLEIEDPRWIARLRGNARRTVRWDDIAAP